MTMCGNYMGEGPQCIHMQTVLLIGHTHSWTVTSLPTYGEMSSCANHVYTLDLSSFLNHKTHSHAHTHMHTHTLTHSC